MVKVKSETSSESDDESPKEQGKGSNPRRLSIKQMLLQSANLTNKKQFLQKGLYDLNSKVTGILKNKVQISKKSRSDSESSSDESAYKNISSQPQKSKSSLSCSNSSDEGSKRNSIKSNSQNKSIKLKPQTKKSLSSSNSSDEGSKRSVRSNLQTKNVSFQPLAISTQNSFSKRESMSDSSDSDSTNSNKKKKPESAHSKKNLENISIKIERDSSENDSTDENSLNKTCFTQLDAKNIKKEINTSSSDSEDNKSKKHVSFKLHSNSNSKTVDTKFKTTESMKQIKKEYVSETDSDSSSNSNSTFSNNTAHTKQIQNQANSDSVDSESDSSDSNEDEKKKTNLLQLVKTKLKEKKSESSSDSSENSNLSSRTVKNRTLLSKTKKQVQQKQESTESSSDDASSTEEVKKPSKIDKSKIKKRNKHHNASSEEEASNQTSSRRSHSPTRKLKVLQNIILSPGKSRVLSLDEKVQQQYPNIRKITVDDVLSDLSESEEIYILHTPQNIELLKSQKIDFRPGGKLKVGNEKCVVKSLEKLDYNLVVTNKPKSINFSGHFKLDKHVKSKEKAEVLIPQKSSVPLPENLKTRHPLFGAEYLKKINLDDIIEQKLQEAMQNISKREKKKKKKKKTKTSESEEKPLIFDLLNSHTNTSSNKKVVEKSNETTQSLIDQLLSTTMEQQHLGNFKEKKKKKQQQDTVDATDISTSKKRKYKKSKSNLMEINDELENKISNTGYLESIKNRPSIINSTLILDGLKSPKFNAEVSRITSETPLTEKHKSKKKKNAETETPSSDINLTKVKKHKKKDKMEDDMSKDLVFDILNSVKNELGSLNNEKKKRKHCASEEELDVSLKRHKKKNREK